MTSIWYLIQKELRQNLRDKSGMVIMTLFPIILILVLGMSLTAMFESNGAPSKITAYYSADDSPLGSTFRETFVDAAAENSFVLTEITDEESAKKEVSLNNVSTLVVIADNQITLYQNEASEYNASLSAFMVKSFAASYDTYQTIARWDPSAMRFLPAAPQDVEYVSISAVSKSKAPKAMDYYSITMLTMIIMYGAMSGLGSLITERDNRTLGRILATPVYGGQLLAGKLIGAMFTTTFQAAIVFAFTAFVLKTNWGSNFPAVLAIIFGQIFMVTSTGIGVGYLFKSGNTAMSIFQGIIPIFVFLGNGYVNMEAFGIKGPMLALMEISPLRWINRSIIDIIYTDSYTRFVPTIAMCLIVGLVFLIISVIFSGREVKTA